MDLDVGQIAERLVNDRTNHDQPSQKDTQILFKDNAYAISGIQWIPEMPLRINPPPLVIAIHGGTYHSGYFNVAGYSLVQRAANLGIPILALDRPGYGKSTAFPPAEATIIHNAERLSDVIGELWQQHQAITPGVVLIGHSIGGAIAVAIASQHPRWPLLGIAISGVGLASPPEAGEAWAALPDLAMIDLPSAMKSAVMFGPEWTYDTVMPAASGMADAPVPRTELIDIVTAWPASVRTLAAKVNVPVHYRQAEFDRLWITNETEVLNFGRAFSSSPSVDVRLLESTGHCIDFHRVGAALQLEQLAFALRCTMVRPK
jgi:pimeloyl-ACP methyl ester carboxylesterase